MFKKSLFPKGKWSGFTLIELLVVIVIVGILVSIAVATLSKAVSKTRDARRKSDLTTLRTSLVNFNTDNAHFPDPGLDLQADSTEGSDWIPGLRPTYFKTLPKDPQQASLPNFSAFGGFLEKIGGKINDVFAVGTTYYVDCDGGSDTNNGTSQASAWKTLSKANNASLSPGDSLLLKRGCTTTFTGPLKAKWNGTSTAVITIGAYGSGNLPHIRNTDVTGNTVQITGSYQIIEYLEASNDPPPTIAMDPAKCPPGSPQVGGQVLQPKGWRSGFRLDPTAHDNIIRNSKAHDNTVGVSMTFGSNHNKVLGNELTNNTYMSVLTQPTFVGINPITFKEIWLNADDDGGAMGIVLNGDDNEIAYNYFSGNNACTYDYPWDSNNRPLGGPDGISVEVYGSKRNNIHHNRTVNDYSFVEVGTNNEGLTKVPPTPIIYAEDTTLAYNFMSSPLDGAAFLNVHGTGGFGPTRRTAAYNNTVYLTGPNSQAVMCNGCSVEGPLILTLRNNILWAEFKALYSDVLLTGNESNNIFYCLPPGTSSCWWVVQIAGKNKTSVPSPFDSTSKVIDPQFVSAGSDFHLNSNSYGVNNGTAVSCVGCGPDLDGVSVPQGAAVDIGAYEGSGGLPPPVCSDGIDNDSDGSTDFPADPGCTSATDTDETDAPPETCPPGQIGTPPDCVTPPAPSNQYKYLYKVYDDDLQSFTLWALLENPSDSEIYNKSGAKCSTIPPTTDYNFCVGF